MDDVFVPTDTDDVKEKDITFEKMEEDAQTTPSETIVWNLNDDDST